MIVRPSEPRAYLDYNATAPLRPEALQAMAAAFDLVGNPSSVHAEGRRARAAVERAREQVAAAVGARSAEVVFTSGATESNVTVMSAGWDVILLAGIEHDSVDAPARASGAEIVELPLVADGRIDIDALAAAAARSAGRRALLTVQAANNETGVLQPIAEAAAVACAHGIVVHTDAVQAVGRIPVDMAAWNVDVLSLTAHKLGGPKGAGALVIRDGIAIRPLLLGGGQERRRRAGTENVAGIAGFGAAAEAAVAGMADMDRLAALRDRLEAGVTRLTPSAIFVGAGAPRLANTAAIALPGQAAETLVIKLDLAGIAASAGAACSSGKVAASRIVTAMGLGPDVARSAIRLSFGWQSSEADLESFLSAWANIAAGAAARRAVA
jgi:cysteine desulfurase